MPSYRDTISRNRSNCEIEHSVGRSCRRSDKPRDSVTLMSSRERTSWLGRRWDPVKSLAGSPYLRLPSWATDRRLIFREITSSQVWPGLTRCGSLWSAFAGRGGVGAPEATDSTRK
jgi:hypothetical protein